MSSTAASHATPPSCGAWGSDEPSAQPVLSVELAETLPRSGAAWVRDYLTRVRAIYTVQLHSHARHHGAAVGAVIEALREAVGGIFQADGQG